MTTPSLRPGDSPRVKDFIKKQHHDTYPAIAAASADLSGQTVFITGASKGLGKATVVSFAQAGASNIAICARSDLSDVAAAAKEAAVKAGRPEPRVLVLKVDVSSEESVAAAAEAVKEAFGGAVDVVVANAGYLEDWTNKIVHSDAGEWWKSWEVNIKGVYLTAKYFVPLLQASAHARTFIAVSSTGAHGLYPGASAYQGAKFALCRFVQFLDQEYHGDGVVAVGVHPGGVKTELALNMPPDMHANLVDEPELAADYFVWLARERREWLSGRYVAAPWDVDELLKRKDEIVEKDLLKFRLQID